MGHEASVLFVMDCVTWSVVVGSSRMGAKHVVLGAGCTVLSLHGQKLQPPYKWVPLSHITGVQTLAAA